MSYNIILPPKIYIMSFFSLPLSHFLLFFASFSPSSHLPSAQRRSAPRPEWVWSPRPQRPKTPPCSGDGPLCRCSSSVSGEASGSFFAFKKKQTSLFVYDFFVKGFCCCLIISSTLFLKCFFLKMFFAMVIGVVALGPGVQNGPKISDVPDFHHIRHATSMVKTPRVPPHPKSLPKRKYCKAGPLG